MRIAAPLADMTEREWSSQVHELAKTLGYLRYHTHRSKHSPSGFPDEILVRGQRAIALELKTERGKLTEPQKEWIRALLATQIEVYVVRPRQLPELALILSPHTSTRLINTFEPANWLRESTENEVDA